jgi:hypothetical protein
MFNSGVLAASLRPTPLKIPTGYPADSDGGWFSDAWLLIDELRPLVLARYLITFFVGVAATVAWQSYVGTVRSAIAFTKPADQQPPNAILLDTLRGRISRLTADQEQMAREINKLRAAAPTAVLWPSQVPVEADTRSDWRQQPCCQWPPSNTQ